MMAAAAATALAFNLICSGQAWDSYKILAPAENKRAFEITYHVDLSTKRYCSGKCTVTAPIKEVTPTQIVFELEERGTMDDTLTYVSRESGRYFDRTRRYISGDTVMVNVAEGECQIAPFTGLPTPKF